MGEHDSRMGSFAPVGGKIEERLEKSRRAGQISYRRHNLKLTPGPRPA